jgi:hypothetical protein
MFHGFKIDIEDEVLWFCSDTWLWEKKMSDSSYHTKVVCQCLIETLHVGRKLYVFHLFI